MMYYIILILCFISCNVFASHKPLRTSGHSRAHSNPATIRVNPKLVALNMVSEDDAPQGRHSLPTHLQKFSPLTVHKLLVIQTSRSAEPIIRPETLKIIAARFINFCNESFTQQALQAALPTDLIEFLSSLKRA